MPRIKAEQMGGEGYSDYQDSLQSPFAPPRPAPAPAALPDLITAKEPALPWADAAAQTPGPSRGCSLVQKSMGIASPSATFSFFYSNECRGCLEMSGFWSGRLNFKNFLEPEFVPDHLVVRVFFSFRVSPASSSSFPRSFHWGRHIHHQVPAPKDH